MKRTENLLIAADSEHDANMLYAVGLFVPDPFIYLRLRGRNYVVLSDLEIDRVRRQLAHCQVLSLGQYQRKLEKEGVGKPGFAPVIHRILGEKRVSSVLVPSNFGFGLALELQQLGVGVRVKPGSFFPERELKSPAEIKHLTAALRQAEVGMSEAVRILKRTSISSGGRLVYRGAPLTSERLRAAIDTAIVQVGGLASHTIVAGGRQGCDPHESGHGPLRANQPIILDIFPRSQRTGYFGDITRTVVRGRASEAVRKLYATVWEGQKLGMRKICSGVPTADVHAAILDYFEMQGYATGSKAGKMRGFFHGTGHGLGLEIHEAPRMGKRSSGELKEGQVVTVEPGLYYPEIGGVRLEDVVIVTRTACRNLTRFEKILEI